MKKFFKFILALVVICAGIAGGLYLFNYLKAKKEENLDDFDDFDDDYDDDFSDDEEEDAKSYIKIEPEEVKDAVSEAASNLQATVEELA